MRVWHGLNIFSRMPNVLRVREKKTEKTKDEICAQGKGISIGQNQYLYTFDFTLTDGFKLTGRIKKTLFFEFVVSRSCVYTHFVYLNDVVSSSYKYT